MNQHLLANAKAYASLVGAVITAVLGTVPPHTTLFVVLTALAAVATAVTVWRVPNVAPVKLAVVPTPAPAPATPEAPQK